MTTSFQLPSSFDPPHLANRFPAEMESVQGRIAIVGFEDSGKKTLCNSMWGWTAVEASNDTIRNFGLFTLVTLTNETSDVVSILYRLENVDLVIFVLSADKGLTPAAFQWFTRMRTLKAKMLVFMNKADLLTSDAREKALQLLEKRLARPVIAISANDTEATRETVIAQVLRAVPEMAPYMAGEISDMRSRVAHQLIMNTAMKAVQQTYSADDDTCIQSLTQIQTQLIQRVASIYGHHTPETMELNMAVKAAIGAACRLADRFGLLSQKRGSLLVGGGVTFLVGYGAVLWHGASLPSWLADHVPNVWKAYRVTRQPDVE